MYLCLRGVVTDLGKALVRSAPRTLVHLTPVDNDYDKSMQPVEVWEPSSPVVVQPRSLPAPDSIAPISLPAPASSFQAPYRIPRKPRAPSAPASSGIEKPKTHRLSKKKAFVLADKVLKQEAKKKKKNCPRSKRFCKICQVSCNGLKTFYDHLSSRSHKNQAELKKKGEPECKQCNRKFESYSHLQRHLNGSSHLKVVLNTSSQ